MVGAVVVGAPDGKELGCSVTGEFVGVADGSEDPPQYVNVGVWFSPL